MARKISAAAVVGLIAVPVAGVAAEAVVGATAVVGCEKVEVVETPTPDQDEGENATADAEADA